MEKYTKKIGENMKTVEEKAEEFLGSISNTGYVEKIENNEFVKNITNSKYIEFANEKIAGFKEKVFFTIGWAYILIGVFWTVGVLNYIGVIFTILRHFFTLQIASGLLIAVSYITTILLTVSIFSAGYFLMRQKKHSEYTILLSLLISVIYSLFCVFSFSRETEYLVFLSGIMFIIINTFVLIFVLKNRSFFKN